MNRVRLALRNEVPELSGYFQSGGLVDSVLNLGLPAPIDVQVSGMNLENTYQTAIQIAKQIRQASNPGTSSITGKILAISRLGGGNCASSNQITKWSGPDHIWTDSVQGLSHTRLHGSQTTKGAPFVRRKTSGAFT
jgi:hypothetical protein